MVLRDAARPVSVVARGWTFWLVALVLNGLVLANAVLHFPLIGYDAPDHLRYIHVLTTRLPAPADTGEFFSPPLPYILPAIVERECARRGFPGCDLLAGKTAQGINFLLSLGITLLFWKIAETLQPGDDSFKAFMLAMVGVLTVYYRSFSQVRGEPYLAFFITLLMFLVLRLLKNLPAVNWKDGLALGLVVGACLLSRQWGALVIPALGVLYLAILRCDARAGWRILPVWLAAGATAFVVSGWFYLHLYSSYGTFIAFNKDTTGFSFANQEISFFTATGLENGTLFTHPVRPALNNTLFPIFYADTWGDYWGYFTFIPPLRYHFAPNGPTIAPYLGRVNLAAIPPSLLLLAGLAWGGAQFLRSFRLKTVDPPTFFSAFLFAGVVFSLAGYLWFLVSYPEPESGDTNKATYMIQIFMFLPALAALLAGRIRARKPALYRWLAAGALLVFLHNLPALVTRYVP